MKAPPAIVPVIKEHNTTAVIEPVNGVYVVTRLDFTPMLPLPKLRKKPATKRR